MPELNVLMAWSPSADLALTMAVLAVSAVVLSAFAAMRFSRKMRQEVARRQRVEIDAADEKNRLNAILSNAAVGVLLADRHTRHVDVNRQWCRMFGYRRREVRGTLKARDIAHPDEADSLEKHFRALLAGEVDSHTHERRFVRKDGSVFWGMISTSTVRDDAGRRLWAVGMITDIDAQKRVEEELRESEERLRFITENTHDVVWQLDRNFRFTYINGADERMRGYGRDEVIGSDFRELLTASGKSVFDLAVLPVPAAANMPASAINFEVELGCKDGSRVWAEINCTPIHDQHAQIIGYIGVTRDSTERRQHRERLREQTIRDPLTGLFNRRYLDESLPRELARARRENTPLSVVMLDIDHFKRLNDGYGHLAGDAVIRRLGALISKGARGGDLPCRYGGEEFLLVLPNMGIEAAVARAEQWRESFQQLSMQIGGESVSATFSAGVAAYPLHGEAVEPLIQAADKALYAAKNAGRNCVIRAE